MEKAKKETRIDDGKKRGDTRLYSIWENMKTRCYNKKAPKYKTYGAKGIRVCKKWKDSYDSFYDWAMDNGYKPSLSLDRINPEGNYEPSNCRWANNTEQANNKSNSRKVNYKGEEMDISELSKKTGLARSTLYKKSDEDIKKILKNNDSSDKKQVGKVYRLDSIRLDRTYYTKEGYLIDHPIVTRCGIFEYADPEHRDGIRRELRIPEEVFSEESLASYEGKPIIITHDAGEIDKNNVHEEQIGTILSKGYKDGNCVRCKIVIHNTDMLKKCGLRELSLGYALSLDETPGIYRGQKYDGIQRDIKVNHLALVGEARAGDNARLNIDHKEAKTKKYLKGGPVMAGVRKKVSKKRFDSDLTPEELEQAIAMFKAQKAAENADEDEVKMDAEDIISGVRERKDRRDSEEEQMDAEEIIAEQEGDIEALLEVIDELQASNDMSASDENDTQGDEEDAEQNADEDSDSEEENADDDDFSEDEEEETSMNKDSVDKIVEKRLRDFLDVCRVADRLNIDGVEGMSLKEARKKVIKKVSPKLNLDGKTDAYIKAAYDIAKQNVASRKKVDAQRRQMTGRRDNFDSTDLNVKSSSTLAREKLIERREGGKK